MATPDWVNITDYIATANEITNAELQDALDALPAGWGVVYFPAGQYVVKGASLVVARSDVTLQGDGKQATRIQLEDKASPTPQEKDQYTLVVGEVATIRHFIRVCGMTITSRPGDVPQTQYENSTSNCLKIVNVEHCTFEDLALSLGKGDKGYENTTLLLAQEGTPGMDAPDPAFCQYNIFRNINLSPANKRGIHITTIDHPMVYNTASEWSNIIVGPAGKDGEQWYALHIEGTSGGQFFVNCQFEVRSANDDSGIMLDAPHNAFTNVWIDGTAPNVVFKVTANGNGTRFLGGAIAGNISNEAVDSFVLRQANTRPTVYMGSNYLRVFRYGEKGEGSKIVAYFASLDPSEVDPSPESRAQGIALLTTRTEEAPHVTTISSTGWSPGDLALASGNEEVVRIARISQTDLRVGIRTTSPKTTLHSVGSTILGAPSAANADGDLGAGQVNIWVDQTTNELKFKVKYPNGTTVRSGAVSLV